MTLLESRITNFYTNFQVDEIGRVISVGDGIARVYGLKEIQAGIFYPRWNDVGRCSLFSSAVKKGVQGAVERVQGSLGRCGIPIR